MGDKNPKDIKNRGKDKKSQKKVPKMAVVEGKMGEGMVTTGVTNAYRQARGK